MFSLFNVFIHFSFFFKEGERKKKEKEKKFNFALWSYCATIFGSYLVLHMQNARTEAGNTEAYAEFGKYIPQGNKPGS